MNTDYPIKNATFFSLKDGTYEKICVCDEIQTVHVEYGRSDRPDLVGISQTFSLTGEFEFRPSLMNLIRLFGFFNGIKTWFRMKFRKE